MRMLVFVMVLLASPVLAQTTVIKSDPSETVCTSGAVTSATVAWDAVENPQSLQLVDGNGVVQWTLQQYDVAYTTNPASQTGQISVPSGVTQTLVNITPAATVCVSVRASGVVPVISSKPLTAPKGFKIVTTTTPPPPAAATWSTICATTSDPSGGQKSSCVGDQYPQSRGYLWRIPFDPVNQEFLLYVSSLNSNSIYSKDLWGLNIRTGVFNKRVAQDGAANENLCPSLGAPAQKNPAAGHPLGTLFVDPVINILYLTGALCGGYNAEVTNRYDLSSKTMLSPLNTWPLWKGASISFDGGMVYSPGAGKGILCCGDNQQSIRVVEFNSMTGTYTNVSDLVRGADGVACDYNVSWPNPISGHCPVLRTGNATMVYQSYVWIFGGWLSSGQGTTDLYRYDPISRVVTKIMPVGNTQPPATQGAFPLAFMDTNRGRIVYLAATGELWQYVIQTNTWSQFAATGSSPLITGMVAPYPGRAAEFDAGADKALFFISFGQGAPPDLRVLTFSGQQQ